MPIFAEISLYIYIFNLQEYISCPTSNWNAGDTKFVEKRPLYDVRNDAQIIFTILFVSKKMDNGLLIHWGLFSIVNIDIWDYMATMAARYSEAILNTKSLFPWPFVTLTAIEHLATQQRVSEPNVFSSHSEYHGEVPRVRIFAFDGCPHRCWIGFWETDTVRMLL